MTRLAVQLAEFALAHLPAPLRAEGDVAAVEIAASTLAAVPRLGLECHLSGGATAIDLSVHLRRTDRDISLLRELCAGRGAAPGWRALANLAASWEDGALADAVDEIWLEADAASGTCPSVFLGFDNGLERNLEEARLGVALLAPQAKDAVALLIQKLERAANLGLVGGNVIGVMLGRGGELRCTLHELTRDRLRAFAGDQPPILDAILASSALSGRDLRLAIGSGPDADAFGIEILPGQAAEGGWETDIVALLIELAQVSPERAQAIGQWTGSVNPTTARGAWPDALILRDLAAPAGPPPFLSKFVNHLKLVVRDRHLSAKAYLGLVAS